MTTSSRHERLAAMYDAHAPRVYAYCLRQVGAHDADDVMAETFAVACRRADVVPDDALPWLVTVARNVVRNRRRSVGRQRELAERLRDVQEYTAPPADAVVLDRDAMLRALAVLTEREREALLLVAWDGLSPDAAARVCRCSTRAFRARVTRARARLDEALTDVPAQEDCYDHR